MKEIMSNWGDFFSEVADSIVTLPTFRAHHEPIAGVFRHPAADAYAYSALLTVAQIQHRSQKSQGDNITVTINTTKDSSTVAREIIRLIEQYRRRSGGSLFG